jgi:heme O synthase-like polyprenyltransferase
MSHPRTIAILGLVLVLIPFLGVPSRWKMTGVALIGIWFIYTGYMEYRKNEQERLAKEEKTKTYTESNVQENSPIQS